MAKNYNQKLIKIRRSYNPSEIARLFGIERKTCFRWIKNEGLRVIKPNTNPLLVMGADLKNFIVKKQKDRKVELKVNEYFCVKCQKAVRAKTGTQRVIKTGKTVGKDSKNQLNQIGLCEFCETKLNKFLRV